MSVTGKNWLVRITYNPSYPHQPFVVERAVWRTDPFTPEMAVAMAQQQNGNSCDIGRVEVVEILPSGKLAAKPASGTEKGETSDG